MNAVSTTPDRVTLYYRAGTSDKVYQAAIEPAEVNIQRSVEISLFKGRNLVSCGNVTIPANQPIPPVGQVVEVRYLYAFQESGVLYQPVYLEPRTDVDAVECLASQLKFKADAVEEEAG